VPPVPDRLEQTPSEAWRAPPTPDFSRRRALDS